MRVNKIAYGCSEHHASLTGFSRIQKIITKVCGNIEVYGTCCTCGERRQQDYCEGCLR